MVLDAKRCTRPDEIGALSRPEGLYSSLSTPPVKRAPAGRAAPKLGAYRELIDEWLTADLEAPRKQRRAS